MEKQTERVHKAKRGMTLPISGAVSSHDIVPAPQVEEVALVARDYVGLRPSMKVKEGDAVKRGQPLFEDRKNPGVVFTSPGCGTVSSIGRGARRALQSVVISLAPEDGDDDVNEVAYPEFDAGAAEAPSSDYMRHLLLASGMWTALRMRPFGKVLPVDASIRSIFVTLMDSHPLAPSPDVVVGSRVADFRAGMRGIVALADGRPVYCCKAPTASFPLDDLDGVQVHSFSGKHPAGTVGFHIHCIDPVDASRRVAHLGYQDVIAIGHLLRTGKQGVSRVVTVAGPGAVSPRLLDVRLGSQVTALVKGNTHAPDTMVLSGSVYNGFDTREDGCNYLGRYHNQITLLHNDNRRRFLGWMSPGFKAYSVTRLFASALLPNVERPFSNDQHGGHRTLLPFSVYDKVMAFDLMPVFLLRALLSEDVETSLALGALELDEEDLALCTFVCPSKNEYGPALRRVLDTIEKEG